MNFTTDDLDFTVNTTLFSTLNVSVTASGKYHGTIILTYHAKKPLVSEDVLTNETIDLGYLSKSIVGTASATESVSSDADIRAAILKKINAQTQTTHAPFDDADFLMTPTHNDGNIVNTITLTGTGARFYGEKTIDYYILKDINDASMCKNSSFSAPYAIGAADGPSEEMIAQSFINRFTEMQLTPDDIMVSDLNLVERTATITGKNLFKGRAYISYVTYSKIARTNGMVYELDIDDQALLNLATTSSFALPTLNNGNVPITIGEISGVAFRMDGTATNAPMRSFMSCSSLVDPLIFPDGITTTGQLAMSGIYKYNESTHFPRNLTSIGD
jgi:hypothetical protein